MLDQTSQLLNELKEKILTLCHVDDIEKEIEDADDFTLQIMTVKDEISLLTTPSKSTIIGTPPPPSTNLATTPSTINSTSNPLASVKLNQQGASTTTAASNTAQPHRR